MSDPTDFVALATHAGTGVAGAGVVGAFLKWVAGKEAQEVSTRLALMEQKLEQILASQTRHESFGERLALAEAKAIRAHERIDELRDRFDGRKKRT